MDCTARLPLDAEKRRTLERLIASYESGESILPREMLARAPLPESRLGVERLAERIAGEAARGVYGKVYAIVGEWGLGKSWAGSKLVEILRDRGVDARVEHFDNLLNHAMRAMGDTPAPDRARTAMEQRLASQGLPAVVVVDEVESVIRMIRGATTPRDRAAILGFLDLLKSLFDTRLEYGSQVRGRVTLVLLLTREAFNLLRDLLASMGVAGRFFRRSDVVFLQPLARYESVELARYYVEALTGMKASSVFEDERLLEVFHTVSGGVPGTLQEAIIKVLRIHAERCGNCICRVTARSLVEALSQITVTSEAGTQYTPLDGEEADYILEVLGDSGEALLLVASTSALEPGEASRASRRLRGTRVKAARVWGFRVDSLAGWFERARSILCPSGDEACVSELRSSAGNLVHLHPGGGWVVTLPEDRGELVAWLEYYGWTGPADPGQVYEALRPGPGTPGWLVLRPEYASSLYKSRILAGLEFVLDPKIREEAREKLRRAEEDEEKLAQLVAGGLGAVLEYSSLATPGGEPGVRRYRYEWRGYGASTVYEVPIRVMSEYSRPAEACRRNPVLQASIILVISGEPTIEEECPGLVRLTLEAGTARRLALIAAALQAAYSRGEAVDREALEQLAQRIARDLGLPDILKEAAERLRKANIIVEPRNQALALVAPQWGDSYTRAAQLVADAHRYLAIAADSTGKARVEDVLYAAGLLAELAPYGKGQWCGVQIPKISSQDLGKSRREVEAKLRQLIQPVIQEGLARMKGDLLESTVHKDPIAARILEHMDGKTATLEEIAGLFILPADDAYRKEALERINARLRALADLGYARQEKGSWRISRQRSLASRPSVPHSPKLLYGQVEKAANTILKASPGTTPRHLGSLLIYKKKDAKIITPELLRETYDYMQALVREWAGYPAKKEYYDGLKRLYSLYLSRFSMSAVQALHDDIEGLLETIRTKAHEANSNIRLLAGLVKGEGPLATLVSKIRRSVDESLERARSILSEAVAESIRLGDELVEDPSRGVEGEEHARLSFTNCERSRQPPKHFYSPHLYYWIGAKQRYAPSIEEALKAALELSEMARELAVRVGTLGLDPDIVASRILESEGKTTLDRALGFMIDRLEDEIESIRAREAREHKIREKLARVQTAVEDAAKIVEEAERLIQGYSFGGALPESVKARLDEAKKALRTAEGEVSQVRSLLSHGGRCVVSDDMLKTCLSMLERAAEYARRAGRMALEAKGQAERVHRELVEEARRRLNEAREEVEKLNVEAATLYGEPVLEQEVRKTVREASRLLESVDPEQDPSGAVRAAEQALKMVDDARARLIPEESRRLYEILVRLRDGEEPLDRVLLEVEGAVGELDRGIEALLRMASRLGYTLTVRARRRRG